MSGATIIVIVALLAMVGTSLGTVMTGALAIIGLKLNQKDWKMSKAPETCLYCHGTGEGPGSPCGFCIKGKPLDTQEDWDNSWGKLDNWHNEVMKDMGWFGGKECKASISGNCLAITQNNPYCEPECEKSGTMDGPEHEEGDV